MNMYQPLTANYPRNFTDKLFVNYKNNYRLSDITEETARFVEDKQLLDTELWITFAEQFELKHDPENLGWRCEYWGKMMRGASLVYAYTKNMRLLETLTATVRDIMTKQDERGRISTYNVANEFQGWDMWGRKYVLLGMQYFLEINEDKQLHDEVVNSMCRQVNYLISKIGAEEGKIQITKTSRHWYGLNSSSILEPVVRLYNLTGDKKYLDFAQYIADQGATYADNIFRLAEKKELRPYQYPVTKAYEMISCFEGLLELYRVTKTDWYKTALINFADLIFEDELSIIGCSGCTHELFDHTVVRQANTTNHKIMQETCVTVTLMKFFAQMNLLTADVKYIDAFEKSYYNAYLGSVNTKDVVPYRAFKEYGQPNPFSLPFFSNSPLTAGNRNEYIGGFQKMEGGKVYGCCVCIAAAGVGMVPRTSVLTAEDGVVLNLYLRGKTETFTPSGKALEIVIDTEYPADGKVKITLSPEKEEEFVIYLRVPDWSKTAEIKVCGEAICSKEGYNAVKRVWKKGDIVELCFDMSTEIIRPIPYGTQILMNRVVWGANSITTPGFDREDPEAKHHFALRRGPIMLARDEELEADITAPIVPKIINGFAALELVKALSKTQLTAELTLEDGKKITLCDYASSGKSNENHQSAVWLKTK